MRRRAVRLEPEQVDALLSMHTAMGEFVGHFDDRWLPPVLAEKYRAVRVSITNLVAALDADQQQQ